VNCFAFPVLSSALCPADADVAPTRQPKATVIFHATEYDRLYDLPSVSFVFSAAFSPVSIADARPLPTFLFTLRIGEFMRQIRWPGDIYLLCHLGHLLGNRTGGRCAMDRTGIGCGENARVGGDYFAEHGCFWSMNIHIVFVGLYIPMLAAYDVGRGD
jgi:hypothetical protein